MFTALVVSILLGGSPRDAWDRVRDAFPQLTGATVVASEPGRIQLRLVSDRLDPAVYDALLAALAPHGDTRTLSLEVAGPDGRDLAPAPLAPEQLNRLGALWRSENPPRRSGRQLDEATLGRMLFELTAAARAKGLDPEGALRLHATEVMRKVEEKMASGVTSVER